MSVKENLQKLIDKKHDEISELKTRLREAEVYIQAVQESMKALPRDLSNGSEQKTLRPGTDVAKTRDVIRAAGKPLHISEILKALGKSSEKNVRVSLTGSLSAYVRDGQIFTRPAPNTFGLVEFPQKTDGEVAVPETFGKG